MAAGGSFLAAWLGMQVKTAAAELVDVDLSLTLSYLDALDLCLSALICSICLVIARCSLWEEKSTRTRFAYSWLVVRGRKLSSSSQSSGEWS